MTRRQIAERAWVWALTTLAWAWVAGWKFALAYAAVLGWVDVWFWLKERERQRSAPWVEGQRLLWRSPYSWAATGDVAERVVVYAAPAFKDWHRVRYAGSDYTWLARSGELEACPEVEAEG